MSTVATPPTLDPTITQRNLDALARTHPDLWQKLQDTALPVVEPAWSRDGGLSLRVQNGWLGRSSIPSVRGKVILEQFDAGPGNVLLPGVAAGYEIDQLLKALSATRAVFVWEQDPVQLALVLRLYDWSAAIAVGRLICLVCDAEVLASRLLDWLRQHPGHLHPERILGWPWFMLSELAETRTTVQAACQQCEQERIHQLAEIRPRLRPVAHGTIGMVSVLAQGETWALADAFDLPAVTVRRPTDMHPLALATRLVETAPDGLRAVVTLGHTRRAVQSLLPDELPVISWLSAPPAREGKPSSRDLLVVTEHRHQTEAIQRGWPPEQVMVLPFPCLAGEPPDDSPRPVDLLLFANLSSTLPESYGVRLPSHIHFWNVALGLLNDQIDRFTDDQTPALLKAAAIRSGVAIDNQELLGQITTCLTTHVARSRLWLHMFATLTATDAKIAIYGQGWDQLASNLVRGPIPSIGERVRVMSQAKALLLADPRGEVSANPLIAAASGTLVVSRSHAHDRKPGGLVMLLTPNSEMVTFRHAHELPTLLQQTIRAESRRQAITDRARERCITQHTPMIRWAELCAAASAYSAR